MDLTLPFSAMVKAVLSEGRKETNGSAEKIVVANESTIENKKYLFMAYKKLCCKITAFYL